MTRKQLQEYLNQYPEDMPVMVLVDNHSVDHKRGIWDTPFNVIRWTETPK